MRTPARSPVTVSFALCGWALLYTLYRAYYGFGGTIGMVGVPASESDFRRINLIGAAILLVVALLPVALLPLWRHPRLRRALLVLVLLLAAGAVMHALVMQTQRVLSLAGLHRIRYPEGRWLSRDDHAADLQDLLFNETWFLVEGLLWGLLGYTIIGRSRSRLRWLTAALLATALLTGVGMLSAFDVIGRRVDG
jgi:membrane glycosyltransferase